MALWLVCTTPDRKVLAGHIVLCLVQDTILTEPLSTLVYKWVLITGVTLRWTSITSRESRNTLSSFVLRDKLRPDEPLAPYGDLTFTLVEVYSTVYIVSCEDALHSAYIPNR